MIAIIIGGIGIGISLGILIGSKLEEKNLKDSLKTLEEIKNFGYKNSGHGYSCAKIADVALRRWK